MNETLPSLLFLLFICNIVSLALFLITYNILSASQTKAIENDKEFVFIFKQIEGIIDLLRSMEERTSKLTQISKEAYISCLDLNNQRIRDIQRIYKIIKQQKKGKR